MSTVVTASELDQALSVLTDLSRSDRLEWFMGQSKNFQQEVALSIKTESAKAAKAKILAKKRSASGRLVQGFLTATIVQMPTKTGTSMIGVSIETEYGPILVKAQRLNVSNVRYLVLFIEDGAIVAKSLRGTIQNVRTAISANIHTHPIAIPKIYELVVRYDYEQALSA